MQHDCIFCKIIAGHIPAKLVAENEHVIAINDISPKAPVHILIIPKKHIKDIHGLSPQDSNYAAGILLMAQQLAQQLSGTQACRLVMNNGAQAGQSVFHLHCHLLSGKQMLDL